MDENNELTIYILQQLRQGIPENAIRDVLSQSGWPQALVDRAFTMILQARPHNLTPSYPDIKPTQIPEAELPAPKDNPRPLILEKEKRLAKRSYLRKTVTIIAVLLTVMAIGAGVYWLVNKDSGRSEQKTSTVNVSLDQKRAKTIDDLADKLMAYYSAQGAYPSFSSITAADFVSSPDGFDASKYTDPAWSTKRSACVDSTGKPTLTETRADDCISYRATALNGGDCDGLSRKCTRVVLTATLDSNKPYIVALDRNGKE